MKPSYIQILRYWPTTRPVSFRRGFRTLDMKPYTAICALLFVTSPVFSYAGEAHASFGDMLWPGSRELSAAPARHTKPADTVEVTFTEASRRNCYRDGVDSGQAFGEAELYQSVLTCDRARTDMLDFSTRDLGTCEFTVHEFQPSEDPIPVPNQPNLYKAGTFRAWCALDSIDAEAAGSCQQQPQDPDKVYLSITGGVYWVINAILSSYPRGPARNSECYDSRFYPRLNGTKLILQDRDNSVVNRTMHGAAAAAKRSGSEPGTSPAGSGLYTVVYTKVMHGVVSVATSVKGARVENGVFEMVTEAGSRVPGTPWDWDTPWPVTAEEAKGQHIFDPFRAKFTLNKVGSTAY